MNAPRFTVIVPAFASEKYLPDAAASLKNQTFRDFEAIFVVEDSPDRSLELCRALAADDDRFRVEELPLSGSASCSRNLGIRLAKGEYVVFLDGDDWLDPDALGRIDATLRQYERLDVLLLSAMEWSEGDDGVRVLMRRISNFGREDEGRVVSGTEAIILLASRGRRAVNYSCLNVCRADFLRENELLQIPGIQQEDTEWVPRVWLAAKRVAVLDYAFYHYRRRPGSVQTACSPKLLEGLAVALDSLLQLAERPDLPHRVRAFLNDGQFSMLYWYLFHPMYRKRFTNEMRRGVLHRLAGTDEARRRFLSAAKRCSFPKRLAAPLVLFAERTGFFAPARLFFRLLYFPLAHRKKGVKR